MVRAALLVLAAGANTGAGADGYEWKLPVGLRAPPVPADNPMSSAKVTLGERLFSDVRLSVTGTYSCASCHIPALAFTDGRTMAIGATGEHHTRNTPTLINVAYAASFGWADPSLTTLEAQHRVPMFNHAPVELGLDEVLPERLVELGADPLLAPLREVAFPGTDTLTLDQMIQAIASYVRTLISADSVFDRYLYWGEDSLTPGARRGMKLFFSDRTNCSLCHASFNLSGPVRQQGVPDPLPVFHNTGLYNINGTGRYPDAGLETHTHRAMDMGAFRAPTLRNVAVTAPYMHDGSVATLRDVLAHYARGGRNWVTEAGGEPGTRSPHQSAAVRGFALSEDESDSLLAFLEALTDEAFVTAPRFADPFR